MAEAKPPNDRQAFDAVVAENLRAGLYLTQRDALISCIRDIRYPSATGSSSLPSSSTPMRRPAWHSLGEL
jgi:hypothetical protein